MRNCIAEGFKYCVSCVSTKNKSEKNNEWRKILAFFFFFFFLHITRPSMPFGSGVIKKNSSPPLLRCCLFHSCIRKMYHVDRWDTEFRKEVNFYPIETVSRG